MLLNLRLIPIVDPARATLEGVSLEGTSSDLTEEYMRNLCCLLEQRVRMGEALVEYAIAIAGRPGTS